jgi:hypothetical protein
VHASWLLTQLGQVPAESEASLDDECSRLVQSQRQVPKFGRDIRSGAQVTGRGMPGLTGQDLGCRTWAENVQPDWDGQALPVNIAASRQDYAPFAELGQQRFDITGILDVVQDQEPPGVCLEPTGSPSGGVLGGSGQGDLGAQPRPKGR